MSRRLYFLVPDIDTAHTVVDHLKQNDVAEDDMSVVARDSVQTSDLPQADVTETSDLVGSAERGAAAGGVTGVVAGLAAVAFPPAGLAIGGGLVAATGLAGAGFGAWASSMIGIRHDNSQIETYEKALENGQVLFMVDVAAERVDEIEGVIQQAAPSAKIEGTDAPDKNAD
ncbi:general stress protein [Salinisphaera sp.]|uniref:general stress protein n=1 Tax=Salinisphaera sp. TaxID=1914330 RepID=UPI000C39F4C2|nr:general stress protein [Salinisphaera sp.]MBS64478.1 DUF1269 domain-containing protein [Salinisphaera sp.]